MAQKKTEAAGSKAMAALRKLDRSGLVKELNESRRDLYLLQMKKVAGELKETHQVKTHKKKVAQVLTLLNQIQD